MLLHGEDVIVMMILPLLVIKIQSGLRYDRHHPSLRTLSKYQARRCCTPILQSRFPGQDPLSKIFYQDLLHVASGCLPPRYCAYRTLQQSYALAAKHESSRYCRTTARPCQSVFVMDPQPGSGLVLVLEKERKGCETRLFA